MEKSKKLKLIDKFWKLYRKIYKLPKLARIEACSICQLDCRDCYMRKNSNNNPIIGNGYLKFDDFKNFIKRNQYIKQIELSFSGEIFLNPDLLDIIKYAYTEGIILTAHNGVNFNNVSDEILEALVKYKFKGITISIDGTSNETYKRYRRNGNYDTVINNIKKLNNYKEKYNSIFPILTWQYIVFEHNKHEICNIDEIAKELNFARIYLKEAWNNEVKIHEITRFPLRILTNSKEIIKTFESINFGLCEQLWYSPQINWDGTLLGCCCSTHHNLNINVFKTGLKKALSSKKMKLMKNIITGKEHANDTIACNWCYLYKIKKEHNTFINPKKLRFN